MTFWSCWFLYEGVGSSGLSGQTAANQRGQAHQARRHQCKGTRLGPCYNPSNRHARKETDRFHILGYEDLIKRDKVSLDVFWLKDDSLEGLSEPARS